MNNHILTIVAINIIGFVLVFLFQLYKRIFELKKFSFLDYFVSFILLTVGSFLFLAVLNPLINWMVQILSKIM
jgi:uncharacterized membrane protein